jgi:hypothetical protein
MNQSAPTLLLQDVIIRHQAPGGAPGFELVIEEFSITRIEVFTNVMNLFDELYATNVTRGNRLTDRSAYTPAAPRTFVIGLQYNFSAKK